MHYLTKFFDKNSQLAYFSVIYFIILVLWYISFLINNNFELIYNTTLDNYYFKPYFSLYIFDLLLNIDLLPISSVLNILIIPFSIFLILFKIYRCFIDSKYAFLFSLISLSIFNETNFRDFLYHIITFDFNIFLVNDFPLIFKLPFPSLSVFIFLAIFYMILKLTKFNNKKFVAITIMSSFYFYINALDSLFLLLLWFFYIITVLIKIKQIKFLFLYLFITLIILIPGLSFATINQSDIYLDNNLYNLILYNFLPLILSLTFFYIKRIDLYEVWFKFKLVYLFIFSEILINAIVYLNLFNIDLSVLNRQVFQFVIHLLYYTPIIYYGTIQSRNYRFGTESNNLSKKLSNFFVKLLVNYKSKIFYLLVILLFLFNFPYNLFYGA